MINLKKLPYWEMYQMGIIKTYEEYYNKQKSEYELKKTKNAKYY